MDEIVRIGMDTAKNVFHLHGVNEAEEPVLRRRFRRAQMIAFMSRISPTIVGIEAGGAAHYWARTFAAMGHEVRIMAPQLVKPYVKRGKNDAADAEALCEAMDRPTMRFVSIKTAEQQSALMLVSIRDRLVRSRTQLTNSIRGYAAEFGVIAASGISQVATLVQRVAHDESLPELARSLFHVRCHGKLPPSQSGTPVLTAIVKAGSVDNALSIYVANADPRSSVGDIVVRVDAAANVSNLRVEPARIAELEPNSAREVTVRFDVSRQVPDEGARETVRIRLSAGEGMLDHSELTLHLGIETDATRLQIVPLLVGMTPADAESALRSNRLVAEFEELELPQNRDLYGLVAGQSVAAGTIVSAGTAVVLAAFPEHAVTVPDVVGMRIEEATLAVAQAGLRSRLVPLGDAPNAEAAETVERSAPHSGAEVAAGGAVALFAHGLYRSTVSEPEAGPEAVAARGAWDQPWRGRIRLESLTLEGRRMSIMEAADFIGSKHEAALAGQELSDDELLLAMPHVIGDGIGGAIEAMIFAAAFIVSDILESGIPLSIAFVEEQDGYRMVVPGTGNLIDPFNALVGGFPLLMPEGGQLLRVATSHQDMGASGSFILEVAARPDWAAIEITARLEVTGIAAEDLPHSFEIVVTAMVEPGLYDPDEYELDVLEQAMSTLLRRIPDELWAEVEIPREYLENLSREELRTMVDGFLRAQTGQ